MAQEAYKQLEALIRLFEEHALEELIVEEGDFKVHLRSPAAEAPPHVVVAPTAPPPHAVPGAPLPTERDRTVTIRAPLIGTFYRSASPDSPPFAEVGERVEEGQTVCIIEAMKVFNEIKTEWSGRVVEIPAHSGKLVQGGDALVVIELPTGQIGEEGT